MSDRINNALKKLFEKTRIVFWYDHKMEMAAEFAAVKLPRIEKIELKNNEFAVKYHMLREEPEKKFLVYHNGPSPDDTDNWLLDVQLAHLEFKADQSALWLAEAGLNSSFLTLVENHSAFFQVERRREQLKSLMQDGDTLTLIQLKMIAICAGADARLDSILETLLEEEASGREDTILLLEQCGLTGALWRELHRSFNYNISAKTPTIYDFAGDLFQACYMMIADSGMPTCLNSDALVFLKRWKDSRTFSGSFEILSARFAEDFGIESDLQNRDFRVFLESDIYRLFDLKIISEMVNAVALRTVPADQIWDWIRMRRNTHWFGEFTDLYNAVGYAAHLLGALENFVPQMQSFHDGIRNYCSNWYLIDKYYRKFIYSLQKSGQVSKLEGLLTRIEKLYVNNYLLCLNDNWQQYVENTSSWEAPPFLLQRNFFAQRVVPFIEKNHRVCIVVSDALRYEIGEELTEKLNQNNRFEAKLEAALAMLPSYTQLGMAALLPNSSLALTENESGNVLVDDLNSQGTAGRQKIMGRFKNKKLIAASAVDVLAMNQDDRRAFLKDNDVIYIYHDRIDAAGKRDTDDRVFEAAEETVNELIQLVRKLSAANASNILITSDHGFLYQYQLVEESDFAGDEPTGREIFIKDRRFVIGKGLKNVGSLYTCDLQKLGLEGQVEVQIPKSINRLRKQGSSMRFMHGGATLQEVVIPVIRVNIKKESDVSQVEIDILPTSSATISSGQLALIFYQKEPVTEKLQGRCLRAGIYSDAGDLVSDLHELVFDSDSEKARDREQQVRFLLTRKADALNGQQVFLKLEEKIPRTSRYKDYKSAIFLVRRSFTSDFDL
ncbi:MAG TPA: BREX-1 system phosphatase PglZ type A [Candidatus Riflebacteria bacterium]|nr:BREX-1 system phosphatase PglZ type A [Candidatus Riflebacteria bacterium]